MTTLASAVAIGDNQLLIDAPFAAGQIPAWVKIDTEMLYAGGQHFRTGTTLTLSAPATATHSNGATVTYAGRPYDADFRSATGGGGGGAIAVSGTDSAGDPLEVAAATSLEVVGMNLSEPTPGVASLLEVIDGFVTWLVSGDGSGELSVVGNGLLLTAQDVPGAEPADATTLQMTPTGADITLDADSGQFTVGNGGTGPSLVLGITDFRVKNSGAGVSVIRVVTDADVGGGPGLGFYDIEPIAQPVIPAVPDAQDIADVLVALGLATQTP